MKKNEAAKINRLLERIAAAVGEPLDINCLSAEKRRTILRKLETELGAGGERSRCPTKTR